MRGLIAQGAAALTALLLAAPVSAQQSDGDWAHYAEESAERGKECWAVSEPTSTVNTRDGAVVTVSRGEILLFVFYRARCRGAGAGDVYRRLPLCRRVHRRADDRGRDVPVVYRRGMGVAATPEDDARITAAMQRGAEAVMVARSGRGTTTQDTFSLLGFTAMNQAAQAACAGS